MAAAREKRCAESIPAESKRIKVQAAPASSIKTRWKFIPPGRAASGVEGKDYFLGEDRVLAHYASDPTLSSTEAAEVMTPVGTVVEQPQPTPHDTTGSTEMVGITASSPQPSGSANPTNGDRGDISSDAAEEDEFELVPRDARVLRPRPTAVISQGTSLFGSSGEDDRDDEAVIVDDDGGDSNYESEASCILSSDSENDLNKMEDGEDPNDYGGLDSGKELEEDDIVDEEDAQDGDEDVGGEREEEGNEDEKEGDDPNAVESFAERHFAMTFLE
ncbi:hypothetical protein GQ600_7389 [Phytophthora cactorum]|nr:hypothetical protein GQ600_7389 [Phytophthora cactorum]